MKILPRFSAQLPFPIISPASVALVFMLAECMWDGRLPFLISKLILQTAIPVLSPWWRCQCSTGFPPVLLFNIQSNWTQAATGHQLPLPQPLLTAFLNIKCFRQRYPSPVFQTPPVPGGNHSACQSLFCYKGLDCERKRLSSWLAVFVQGLIGRFVCQIRKPIV